MKQRYLGNSYLNDAIQGLKKQKTFYLEPFTDFIEFFNRGHINEQTPYEQKQAIIEQFNEIQRLIIELDIVDSMNDTIVKDAFEMFRSSVSDFDSHDADD